MEKRDIVEMIKKKLFKKSRFKQQRRVLKPTLCSLFGLGVRFKYCDENLVKNSHNPSMKRKNKNEKQSTDRNIVGKFTSKVGVIQSVNRLKNRLSRDNDGKLEISKEINQQQITQNLPKYTYTDYEKEGFMKAAKLVKHPMKVNYNPAQLFEILTTQNPISCFEYRSPQRNGSMSPHDNSRFEQTMPVLKSKIEIEDYDDQKSKRMSLANRTSGSPSRESNHQRVLSNVDRDFMGFSMSQTRAQTASERGSKPGEVRYMVNEYFEDVNSLDFYMKLREKDREKQETRESIKRKTEKNAKISKEVSKARMTPITSMDKYYRKLWKEKEEKENKRKMMTNCK